MFIKKGLVIKLKKKQYCYIDFIFEKYFFSFFLIHFLLFKQNYIYI